MHSIAEKTSTVLAGAWNTAIFSPPWVREHVLAGEEPSAELLVMPTSTSVRLRSQRLLITPQRQRVTVGLIGSDPSGWRDAAAASLGIIKVLQHTPLTAIGINFAFREAEPADALLEALRVHDDTHLARAGLSRVAIYLRRRFTLGDDGLALNLIIEDRNSEVFIETNFHRDVEDSAAAIEYLERVQEKDLLAVSKGILMEAYGLNLDGGEPNGEQD